MCNIIVQREAMAALQTEADKCQEVAAEKSKSLMESQLRQLRVEHQQELRYVGLF